MRKKIEPKKIKAIYKASKKRTELEKLKVLDFDRLERLFDLK